MLHDTGSVCHELALETVLVVGLELVSYERSQPKASAILHHFVVFVFFEKYAKCEPL